MSDIELLIMERMGMKISSSCYPSSVDSRKYIGSSSTVLYDHETNEEYFFSGASVKDSKDLALRISRFELLERILAMPLFHTNTVEKSLGFHTYRLLSRSAVERLKPEEVLLYGKKPIRNLGKNSEGSLSRSANGLGIHTNYQMAVQHAALEIVERHISCKLWYEPNVSIIQLGSPLELSLGYCLRRFTIGEMEVPYVLSVIESINGPSTFICGSAVSNNLNKAIESADNEAIMMLENIITERNKDLINMSDTLEVLNSLVGDQSELRWGYFEKKISNSFRNISYDQNYSFQSIIESVFLEPEKFTISNLIELDNLSLVRAIHPEAMEKRHIRNSNLYNDIPLDPFC